MPRLLHLVAAHFHDRHIDQHFRLGLIQIVNQLLRQRHLIRRSAHHDRSLRGQLLDAAHLEDRAHRVDYILQFGRLRKIGKIESFENVLFQLFPFCGIVLRDKNGVRA